MKIMKILKFHARIMKIMKPRIPRDNYKIVEFHVRIIKIMKIIEFHLRITELTTKICKSTLKIMKFNEILEFQVRLMKIIKII